MKKIIIVTTSLVLCLAMLSLYGGDMSKSSSKDSSQTSSENSTENSVANSSDESSNNSSENSSESTTQRKKKSEDEEEEEEKKELTAILNETSSIHCQRTNLAKLAQKYDVSEADVFGTVSRLAAEGTIDIETALADNESAKHALTVICNELENIKSR